MSCARLPGAGPRRHLRPACPPPSPPSPTTTSRRRPGPPASGRRRRAIRVAGAGIGFPILKGSRAPPDAGRAVGRGRLPPVPSRAPRVRVDRGVEPGTGIRVTAGPRPSLRPPRPGPGPRSMQSRRGARRKAGWIQCSAQAASKAAAARLISRRPTPTILPRFRVVLRSIRVCSGGAYPSLLSLHRVRRPQGRGPLRPETAARTCEAIRRRRRPSGRGSPAPTAPARS